jgi:iron complex transport system substrate-binding protein
MKENEVTSVIIAASLKIHRDLGPGLLESVYEMVLTRELARRGLAVECQKSIPIIYDGQEFPDPFRADLLVASSILVELKSVEALQPVHSKQLLTYLRLARLKVGLLINFNVPLLKDGINRIVNGFTET